MNPKDFDLAKKPSGVSYQEFMIERSKDDPEMQKMLRHPAITQFFETIESDPRAFEGLPPVSFRMLIKDYEEQQAVRKKIDQAFERLASNPPTRQTGMPQELSSFTYELRPKNKAGRKLKVRIDIQIPATADEHTRERLLFSTNSMIDAMFQSHDEVPTASDITRRFKRTMLSELTEIQIGVFRFNVFEPEQDNTPPKPPLI